MMQRAAKLSLYRDIIRAAKSFPSVKRNKVLQEIRFTFRENVSLHEGEKLDKAWAVAVKGLSQLSMYTDLKKDRSTNWSVTLEQTPMPKPE